MERLRAVGEERRVALTEIQPPRIEFRKRGNQSRGCLALSASERLHRPEELFVGERARFVLHAPVVASQILPLDDRLGNEFFGRKTLIVFPRAVSCTERILARWRGGVHATRIRCPRYCQESVKYFLEEGSDAIS